MFEYKKVDEKALKIEVHPWSLETVIHSKSLTVTRNQQNPFTQVLLQWIHTACLCATLCHPSMRFSSWVKLEDSQFYIFISITIKYSGFKKIKMVPEPTTLQTWEAGTVTLPSYPPPSQLQDHTPMFKREPNNRSAPVESYTTSSCYSTHYLPNSISGALPNHRLFLG